MCLENGRLFSYPGGVFEFSFPEMVPEYYLNWPTKFHWYQEGLCWVKFYEFIFVSCGSIFYLRFLWGELLLVFVVCLTRLL